MKNNGCLKHENCFTCPFPDCGEYVEKEPEAEGLTPQQAYYRRNKDKIREQHRQWRLANPEKVNANRAEWREINRQVERDRQREWYWRNAEVARERQRERYARNREYNIERSKEYYRQNKEAINAKRRAKRRESNGG